METAKAKGGKKCGDVKQQTVDIIVQQLDPRGRRRSLLLKFFLAAPHPAYGILVPRSGIEPVPPKMEAWIFNHWTAREVPPPSPY